MGLRSVPEGVREAARFIAEKRVSRIRGSRNELISKLCRRVDELRPEPLAIRKGLKVGYRSTRAELHLLPLAELLDEHERMGQAWRAQRIEAFPTPGDIAEPGVRPGDTATTTPIFRKQLVEGAKGRVKFDRNRCNGRAVPPSGQPCHR